MSKADITDSGTPFILYGELYTTYGEIAYQINRKTEKIVDKKYYSKIGDVVVPTSGETAEEISTATCIMKDDVILAGDLNIFRGSKIDGRILSYLLNHKKKYEIASVAQGASIIHIKADDLKKIKINVPCKIEQEKIASFLTSIDNIISTQESNISILETYNRGLISQIFKQEIRFKDDNGNEFSDWIQMPLEENIELIIDNRGKTPPLSENGYPLIEINAVGDFFVNYSRIEKYVNENIYHTWFRKQLKKGDILFSTVGTTALCSCYDEKQICCVAQNIVGLRFQETIDNIFMYYLLTEKENNKYIKSIQMNGVQPSIKITQFTKLKFPIPCFEEQKKIANFLTSLDTVLQEEKNYLEYLKTIKKGLLQQMFV